MAYYPQLDALRGLAALGVAWMHWSYYLGISPRYATFGLTTGHLGVIFFFVLSGFLITRILLVSRERATSRGGLWHELRQFYIRRILRIFPLYYVFLFIAGAISLAVAYHSGGKHTFFDFPGKLWHGLYLSNFFFFQHPNLEKDIFIHLWTLSVEEQFYTFWPLVILFAPRTWLLRIFLGMVAAAPLFRLGMLLHDPGMTMFQLELLPFSNWDSLGFGALLAYATTNGRSVSPKTWRILGFIAVSGLLAFVAMNRFTTDSAAFRVAGPILFTVVSGLLLLKASQGFRGMAGKVLESAPLIYLGKISYGFYLMHLIAVVVVHRFFDLDGSPLKIAGLMLGMFLITLLLASLSWFCLERPILRLKSRFP